MGAYINPPDMSKEEWLVKNATRLDTVPKNAKEFEAEGKMFVCLVNNFHFTAAGIMFDQRELETFSDPADRRPKRWYLASKEDLLKVSDLQYFI